MENITVHIQACATLHVYKQIVVDNTYSDGVLLITLTVMVCFKSLVTTI